MGSQEGLTIKTTHPDITGWIDQAHPLGIKRMMAVVKTDSELAKALHLAFVSQDVVVVDDVEFWVQSFSLDWPESRVGFIERYREL